MTLSQNKPITSQIVTEEDRTGLSNSTLRKAIALLPNTVKILGKFNLYPLKSKSIPKQGHYGVFDCE